MRNMRESLGAIDQKESQQKRLHVDREKPENVPRTRKNNQQLH